MNRNFRHDEGDNLRRNSDIQKKDKGDGIGVTIGKENLG